LLLESVCCLLVLDSVTSTPQWIRQPEAAWGVCVVFVCLVLACKYVLGCSRVSSGYASSGTLACSLRRMPPRPATDDPSTRPGSFSALRPAPSHPMGLAPSPSRLAQTSTIYTYNDNLINDSLVNLTKEQPKESLDLNLVISPSP
jgi:hypothetical protein